MTSNVSPAAASGAIWSLLAKVLFVLAGLIGLYALITVPSGAADWFRIGSHMKGISPDVLPGFFKAALGVSVLTLIATSIAWFPGIAISGAQGYAYLAAARVMAGVAAIASAVLGLVHLGIGIVPAILLVFALLTVAIGALVAADRVKLPAWEEFRSDLFDFYSVYVLRPLDEEEGEERAKEVFSEFMHKPDATPVKVLSVAAPAMVAVAGIVSAAFFIQFGFGLVGAWFRHAPTVLELSTGISAFTPTAFFAQLNVGPWQASAVVALIAQRLFVRYAGQLYSSGHPIIINIGMRIFDGLFNWGFRFAVLYMLFVPAGPPIGWWQPAFYGLLALVVIVGVLALAAHAGERLVRRAIALQHAFRVRKFWIDNYFILKRFPQPKNPIGYVILNSQADTYTAACLLLVLCRLRQLGWALIVLDEWPIKVERTGHKHIDRFYKAKIGYQNSLNFDWNIDWKNKKVEAAGMNFYHPIWEGLSRHFGRYTLDIPEGSPAEGIFRQILFVADSTLLYAFRINNTIAGYGKPVRVVGASAQFVPNAVWNIFCREIGKSRDMHFVWLQQGYQTYYADKAKLSTRITLENMTRKWPYSNPYLPHVDDFRAWIAKGQDVKKITDRALAWTKTNRATEVKDMIQPARETYERITTHRAAGKAVICVLGKMVFDLSTPWEKGPAHEGMFDWLNHTVEIARRNPDILYVVKPHPYEARPEIAGPVAQYFTDMIEQSIPDNMIILAHNWFNLHALFPHIDLGVLWNGTSGLELGLHKIPCIICSDWGPVDYPVGLLHPKDRADYEFMMSNPRKVVMGEDYTEKCAMLLEFTASDEVMIPYQYSARPITNEPFGPPYWFWDQVNRFLKEGDPNIDRACEKFR